MGSTSNDMQGYDAIVAVTENNINGNFKFLFGKEDGIRPTIDVELPGGNGARLEGTIQPPKVRLRVEDSPRQVVFIITIQTGSATYWIGMGPSATKATMNISDWTIGFRVNLRLDDLDTRMVEVPKPVQARIKNLGEGMFSVRQLFMDFQTADIASWDKSETKIPDSLTKDTSAYNYFTLMMNTYLDELHKSGQLILGYAVQVKNPNLTHPHAPSIPPTDLNFWVNPYRPEDEVNPQAAVAGLDTLCYLMMTEQRAMPSSTPAWFGNWVHNRDEYGTVAINKTNFFDRFLLPQLASTALLVTTIDKVGLPDQWGVQMDTKAGGTYTPTPDGGEYNKEERVTYRNGSTDVEWYALHTSKISAGAAGSTIQLQGSSEIYQRTVNWAWEVLKLGMHLEWSTSINLLGVVQGELQVQVTQLNVVEKLLDESGWFTALDRVTSPAFSVACLEMLGTLRGLVEQAVDPATLQQRITEKLTCVNAFVFPGGGDFRMFNPRFNEHRDLVVDLRWEQG